MRIGRRIDQLSVDADLATRPPDAPFEHVADTKLAADLLRVDWLVPIRQRGISRDNEHVREPREIGREIVGDPVREVLLLPVVAEVCKGQDDDRKPWCNGRRDELGRVLLLTYLADEANPFADDGADQPLLFATVTD